MSSCVGANCHPDTAAAIYLVSSYTELCVRPKAPSEHSLSRACLQALVINADTVVDGDGYLTVAADKKIDTNDGEVTIHRCLGHRTLTLKCSLALAPSQP